MIWHCEYEPVGADWSGIRRRSDYITIGDRLLHRVTNARPAVAISIPHTGCVSWLSITPLTPPFLFSTPFSLHIFFFFVLVYPHSFLVFLLLISSFVLLPKNVNEVKTKRVQRP
jgi:hypothetical protein